MRQTVRRSTFLAASAAAAAPFGIIRTAKAAEFSYKLAHPDPVDYPPSVRILQIAHAVKEETNGRMEISVFPNGQLGAESALITELRLGSVQFACMTHSIYSSLVPVSQIDAIGFAFPSSKAALAAMDGPLGAYIRNEFAAKGVHVFEKTFESGFREVTTSVRPIKTVDDFIGLKMRVQPVRISVDLFRTLGASPVPLNNTEMYVAMQTHVVDGQDSPLPTIQGLRIYEVQKYLSLTNHAWSGLWLSANAEAWNALPADIRTVVNRVVERYVLLERNDIHSAFTAQLDKLRRLGLTPNTADTNSMRARLGAYYGRWKSEFGTTAWSLLEGQVGKLA